MHGRKFHLETGRGPNFFFSKNEKKKQKKSNKKKNTEEKKKTKEEESTRLRATHIFSSFYIDSPLSFS